MKSIPASVTAARFCASCPRSDGMCLTLSLRAAAARLHRAPMTRGAQRAGSVFEITSTSTLSFHFRATCCAGPALPLEPREHARVQLAHLVQEHAAVGTMLATPGRLHATEIRHAPAAALW